MKLKQNPENKALITFKRGAVVPIIFVKKKATAHPVSPKMATAAPVLLSFYQSTCQKSAKFHR